MYLRPRTIMEKFLVEEKRTRIADNGRQTIEFVPTGEMILGVISIVEPHEVEKWKATKHDVTHSIVQHLGHIKAKVGDRLVKGDKIYIVQAIDEPVGIGQFFVYYVNERADLK